MTTYPRSSIETKRQDHWPHLREPGRVLSHETKAIYLQRTLPSIYAELQQLPMDERYQVLTAIRSELMYWGSMTNREIEMRLRGE